MDLKPMKLEAIEFENPPTEHQIIQALQKVEEFFTAVTGTLLVTGTLPAFDPQQKIGRLLGVAVTCRQTRDAFAGTSSIAVPQLQMSPRTQ